MQDLKALVRFEQKLEESMKEETEDLVFHSHKRKQFGGVWFIASAIGAYAMWATGGEGGGTWILFGVATAMLIMGVHRLTTKSVAVFKKGKIPSVEKTTKHFGIHEVKEAVDFDEISVLRRENLLPYCQLYAFASLKFLETRVTAEELADYKEERKILPGVIFIDHSTKAECDSMNEKIWRFYGLWNEDV